MDPRTRRASPSTKRPTPSGACATSFRLRQPAIAPACAPTISTGNRLPPDRLAGVLLVQPLLQGREVIADGRRVHLARAGDLLERVLPRMADPHLQHRVQLRAGRLAVEYRASVQRPVASGRLRHRAVKLKLQDVR